MPNAVTLPQHFRNNGYKLNGHKLFCTQGHAKSYLVMCRTSKDGAEGYGCVVVEAEEGATSLVKSITESAAGISQTCGCARKP